MKKVPLWSAIVLGVAFIASAGATVYLYTRPTQTAIETVDNTYGFNEKIISLSDDFDKFVVSKDKDKAYDVVINDLQELSTMANYLNSTSFSEHINGIIWAFEQDSDNTESIQKALTNLKEKAKSSIDSGNRQYLFEKFEPISLAKDETKKIDVNTALETAKKYNDKVSFKNEDVYYTFETDGVVIDIDKQTGNLARYRNYNQIGQIDFNKDVLYKCISKGKEKLETMELKNMVSQNFSYINGEVVIEYYPVIDDVIIFSEKVLVGVNGKTYDISLIDLTMYNQNHKERKDISLDTNKIKDRYDNTQSIEKCVFLDSGQEKMGYKVTFLDKETQYVAYIDDKTLNELKICKVYNDKTGLYEL